MQIVGWLVIMSGAVLLLGLGIFVWWPFALWSLASVAVAAIAEGNGRPAIGWWFYGVLIWPVALVHVIVAGEDKSHAEATALASGAARKCPHCAEIIKAEARICRFCGRDVVA